MLFCYQFFIPFPAYFGAWLFSNNWFIVYITEAELQCRDDSCVSEVLHGSWPISLRICKASQGSLVTLGTNVTVS